MIRAPRIFSTGTILYGAAGDFKAEIDSLDDARAHLRRMKAVGAICVKSYNQPRREQRQQILAAAREIGMMVVPEGGSLFEHNMTMVVDGHTSVEHTIPVAEHLQGRAAALAADEGRLHADAARRLRRRLGRELLVPEDERLGEPAAARSSCRRSCSTRARAAARWSPEDEFNHFSDREDRGEPATRPASSSTRARTASARGSGCTGRSGCWSRAACRRTRRCAARRCNGAQTSAWTATSGSLEPGKLADVIVIDGNPLQDIRQSEKVAWTMVNGRLYDAATMNETGSRERKRAKYWWE